MQRPSFGGSAGVIARSARDRPRWFRPAARRRCRLQRGQKGAQHPGVSHGHQSRGRAGMARRAWSLRATTSAPRAHASCAAGWAWWAREDCASHWHWTTCASATTARLGEPCMLHSVVVHFTDLLRPRHADSVSRREIRRNESRVGTMARRKARGLGFTSFCMSSAWIPPASCLLA